MTDDKIIKALQCCGSETTALTCYDCPLLDRGRPSCYFKNAKNALDLIERQKTEIDRLKTIVQIKSKKINCLLELMQEKENEK